MPSKNRNKKRNKRCRLAASADVCHEVAVSESSNHSPLMYSSRESTASTSKFLANSMATPSSRISSLTLSPWTLPSGMYSRTEMSCSVDVGKNKKSLMKDTIHNKSSDEIKHSTITDGHLLDDINSESSCEAVALLITRVSSFTQDELNQALISTCRRGHKLLVQTLVRVGANIEHRDENGNTPLLICAEHGFTDIVRFLVSRNANLRAWNSTGNTALILSVHPAGSTDLTRFLLEQENVDIHHENQNGHTALTRATLFMDVDTMRLLLEKGMARNTGGKIYLDEHEDSHFFNNKAQSIKQEIISSKAGLKNVYAILKENLIIRTSPIELAIRAGDTKSLDIFLDCQFSCSLEKKKYIDNALMHIFSNSRYSSEQTFSPAQITIIQKLLQHGADVSQRYGFSPVSFAVESGDFQLVDLMCTHGATLERRSYSGDKDPLCIAARKGRQDLIELLLQNGADMKNGYGFSQSALEYALRNDHTECAKLLIQHGAKMDVTSALRSAVEHQRPLYMRFLFENYKHEITDCFSKTTLARKLLILAAEKENSEIIGHILDAGVDVNDSDSYGQTPLMASKNRTVAEFLIHRGADVNHVIVGRNGSETPLSHMISRNCKSASTVELCKVLIDNGALVNCRNGEGKTPLMMAASQDDSVSMLQMLLNNGADVNDKDNKGNTALLHAITAQCFENVSCLIDFTRDKKNVINIQNNEGLTSLLVSVMKGSVAIMKKLIENGADINIKDNNENTVLHHLLIVCPRDKEEILTFLLEAGSHVNCQNRDGLSPLMLAAKKSKASMMSKLLDAGADVNAVSKNNNSQTAMSFLPGISYLEDENILCIETLLHRNANSSYLNHEYLSRLIIQNQINVIPKLIQHGLGPADIKANTIPRVVTRCGVPVTLSPLCVALLHGNISLAQYFVDILFLTSSDLFMFANNKDMEHLLKEEDQEKSINFLQELSSQPMSLVKLSLVTVSAAVGSSPGREARVDSLPLPQMMKDRLRFKSMNDEDLALLKLHSELNTTANNVSLVSLLRDQFEILRYLDSDDDDYFAYASNFSDSDDDMYFCDSD